MFEFISKLLYVLQGKRKQLLALIGLFLFVSLVEAFGVGIVGPFMLLATDPKAIQNNLWLHAIYEKLHFSSEIQMVWLVGLLVIATFYLKAGLSFSAQKYIFEFGFSQQSELSKRLMKAYLAAPYTYHLSQNSAVLIQNIVNEADRFANNLLMPLLSLISNAVIIFALIVLLIITNATATITVAGILLIAIFAYRRLKERLAYLGKEFSEARSEMIRVINHGLGGIKETKVIGCENYFEQQLAEQTDRYSRSVSLALTISNIPRYTIEAFLMTFLILFTFVFIAVNQDNSQNLSSVLGVFALASIRMLPATSTLIGIINAIKYNTYALDKLYSDLKDLEDSDDLDDAKPKHQLQAVPGHSNIFPFYDRAALEDVVYAYPNTERKALDGITLEIKKGQSIGLIGKSGAGKTTLVDVILGLLTPQRGDIRVDGHSIYPDLRAWQNMIGYVPQSIFLIDDTLEKNIAFGVPDHLINDERLQKAIYSAQLSELVDQLPDGIQTVVGERGILLSGGQRQRVGIARALYHEREILVFDEATAALDNETESLVTEAIRLLSGVKTMIIIAHRLSTLQHCDKVYVLEKGKVIKSGSYEEIILGSARV